MRRKIENREIRKIFRHGNSRAVTLPKEILSELGWRDNQKVVARKYGQKIIIEDWKPEK